MSPPTLSTNGKRIGRPPIFTREERLVRDREHHRAYDARRLPNLTPEQKQRRKEADFVYKKCRPITPKIIEQRRRALKKYREKKKLLMTPEQAQQEKDRKREYNKAYHLKKKPHQLERARKCSAEWGRKNKARRNELRREWMKSNPNAYRIYAQNRRARKRKQQGIVSRDIAQRLMESQKGLCAACCVSLETGYELDHIIPLARGGKHDDGNLQLLCEPCNRSKGTKDPIQFLKEKGRVA